METRHDTVLLHEAVEGLSVAPGDVVVDGTFGAGGHFRELAIALGKKGTLIGIDADAASFERAAPLLETLKAEGPTMHLVNDNFRNIESILDGLGIACVDKALYDLGWNGFQLAEGRGFSFRVDEPLHMTYGDPQTNTTAEDLVNSSTEEELADLIYTYGEERFSRGIARSIVETRKGKRITTTAELALAVENGTPAWYHHRKIHPATKTFQALRIATNDELGALRAALTGTMSRLTPGGRIAVITFHSIEDRIVKAAFKDAAYAGSGSLVTRKPLTPSAEELTANPRARSAKLRIFERCASEDVCSLTTTHLTQYA
jgi:16S rRNA (cytosine1402-N4)-methyltransferase